MNKEYGAGEFKFALYLYSKTSSPLLENKFKVEVHVVRDLGCLQSKSESMHSIHTGVSINSAKTTVRR